MTRMVPEAAVASRGASARPMTGGPSMMTTSKRDAASLSTARRRSPVSSSAGLGGVGPPGSSLRLPRRVGLTSDWRLDSPANRLLKPEAFSAVKTLCSEGLRRSASIRSTVRPIAARLLARAEAVVDLPSEGCALVISSGEGRLSGVDNRSAVRGRDIGLGDGRARVGDRRQWLDIALDEGNGA